MGFSKSMSHCPHIWPSQGAMKVVHLHTCHNLCVVLSPVCCCFPSSPSSPPDLIPLQLSSTPLLSPLASVMPPFEISLSARRRSDCFLLCLSPLSLSSYSPVLVSLAQFSLGSVSRSRSLARPSSVREPRVSDVVDLQWLCSAR